MVDNTTKREDRLSSYGTMVGHTVSKVITRKRGSFTVLEKETANHSCVS